MFRGKYTTVAIKWSHLIVLIYNRCLARRLTKLLPPQYEGIKGGNWSGLGHTFSFIPPSTPHFVSRFSHGLKFWLHGISFSKGVLSVGLHVKVKNFPPTYDRQYHPNQQDNCIYSFFCPKFHNFYTKEKGKTFII